MKIITAFLLAIILPFFLLTKPVAAASLEFVDTNITLGKNEQKNLGLKVDPANAKVIGVDIVIKYDPNYINILDALDLGVFSQRTGRLIDNTKGVARLSFSNTYGNYLTTPALFTQIVVVGKSETSKVSLNFDYQGVSTKDSNVVIDGGLDLLTSVNSLSIEVRGDSGNGSSSNSQPDPAGTNSSNQKPKVLSNFIKNAIEKIKKVLPQQPTKISQKNEKGKVLGEETDTNAPGKLEAGSLVNLKYIFFFLLGISATAAVIFCLKLIKKYSK